MTMLSMGLSVLSCIHTS